MRPRTVMVALVVVSLAAATPATAATKKKKKPAPVPKVCNLMIDAKDDGDWNVVPVVKSKNIDIVSGDVATGPTELVAVLRLAELNLAADTYARLSYTWLFGFSAGGARYEFNYRRGFTGEENHGVSIANVGISNYTVKIEGNSIVWRVKRAGIAPLTRPNLVFINFGAVTQVLSSTADEAAGTPARTYKDKAPSCVTAK